MEKRSVCLRTVACLAGFLSFMHPALAKDSIQFSEWSVEREIDPILETPNITAVLPESGKKLSFFTERKNIFVECRETRLTAAVEWGDWDPLGFSFLDDSDAKVMVRFGSEKARTEYWPKSSYATFPPDVNRFILLLRMHDRFAIRTFPSENSSLTAVFDLSRARPVLDEIMKACGQ